MLRSFSILALTLLVCGVGAQVTYYVAPAPVGNDSGTGLPDSPWATITHAVDNVPDGSLVLVRPGLYEGRTRLRRQFTNGITVRSETPYMAQLRHTGTVVTSYYGQGITLEGFDIAHTPGNTGALVIQIQDLLDNPDDPNDGPGDEPRTSRITLRNNVIHDSHNNDLLKINNGASDITVEGNIFYNQEGSDEHIDINSALNVTVQDNVFLNDFGGSDRTDPGNTSSYIVIKDSNGGDDAFLGSQNITVRRNVFLNWEGSSGSNYVLCGEDGHSHFEADGVTIENNLMLGNSDNTMRAPFGVKGCRNVLFRSNTVVGDYPSLAFAMRLNTEGSNQANENIQCFNNIWSDPMGSMNDFSDTPAGETVSYTLSNNLYWNNGSAIPSSGGDLVNYTDDDARILGDPTLPSQAGLVPPHWDPDEGNFGGGLTTIRQVFVNLVETYGVPGDGSAAFDQSSAAQTPIDDILGNPRGSTADVGAVEVIDLTALQGMLLN